METLTLVNNMILYVPNGTVCFECNYGLFFSNDVLFRIDDTVINNSYNSSKSARVLNNTIDYTDTLVVFDTAEWFKPFSVTYVQCCDNGIFPLVYKHLYTSSTCLEKQSANYIAVCMPTVIFSTDTKRRYKPSYKR